VRGGGGGEGAAEVAGDGGGEAPEGHGSGLCEFAIG
jgi:hypothetical protein